MFFLCEMYVSYIYIYIPLVQFFTIRDTCTLPIIVIAFVSIRYCLLLCIYQNKDSLSRTI